MVPAPTDSEASDESLEGGAIVKLATCTGFPEKAATPLSVPANLAWMLKEFGTETAFTPPHSIPVETEPAIA
jgi:hypothetical protein